MINSIAVVMKKSAAMLNQVELILTQIKPVDGKWANTGPQKPANQWSANNSCWSIELPLIISTLGSNFTIRLRFPGKFEFFLGYISVGPTCLRIHSNKLCHTICDILPIFLLQLHNSLFKMELNPRLPESFTKGKHVRCEFFVWMARIGFRNKLVQGEVIVTIDTYIQRAFNLLYPHKRQHCVIESYKKQTYHSCRNCKSRFRIVGLW